MKQVLTIMFFFSVIIGSAQISINNTDVHPDVLIDIGKEGKGITLPKMDAATRASLLIDGETPTDGMMVYDSIDKHIYYYKMRKDPDGLPIGPPWCCWNKVQTTEDFDAKKAELDPKMDYLRQEVSRLEDSLMLLEDDGWIYMSSEFRDWENANTNYYKLAYKVDNYNNLYLKGFIKPKPGATSSSVVFILPSSIKIKSYQQFYADLPYSIEYSNGYDHRPVFFSVYTDGRVKCSEPDLVDLFGGVIINLQVISLDLD